MLALVLCINPVAAATAEDFEVNIDLLELADYLGLTDYYLEELFDVLLI